MEDIWEGGNQTSAPSEEGRVKNKEHSKGWSKEYLLKSSSGDQKFLHKSERGKKIPSNI